MKQMWVRPDAAAEIFGVTRGTIYLWVKDGKLESRKVSDRCRMVLIDMDKLEGEINAEAGEAAGSVGNG